MIVTCAARVAAASVMMASIFSVVSCGKVQTGAQTMDTNRRDQLMAEGVLRLKSESGVSIAVDWTKRRLDQSSNKPLIFTVLSKMMVTVTSAEGKPFAEDAKIRAVVVQKMFKDVGCGSPEADHDYEVPYELDLVRQDDGSYRAEMFESGFLFTRDFSGRLIKKKADRLNLNIDAFCETHSNRGTQISVVIDDQWQKDPVNQTNDFVLSF